MSLPIPFKDLDLVVSALKKLSPGKFQELIVDHLRHRPEFRDVRSGPPGRDGGVDITAYVDSPTGAEEKIVFQVKRYLNPVGREHIDALNTTVDGTHAQQGVLVSTSHLTHDAEQQIASLHTAKAIRFSHIAWTSRGLAETLLTKTPHLLPAYCSGITEKTPAFPQHPVLAPLFDIVEVTDIMPSKFADLFMNGYPAQLADLQAGFDINRDEYSRATGIRATLEAVLSGPPQISVLGLTGASGSGKSTILKRAGFDFSVSAKAIVVRLRDDAILPDQSLFNRLYEFVHQSSKPVMIIMDDVARIFRAGRLPTDILIKFGRDLKHPVAFLIADEPYMWPGALRAVQGLGSIVPYLQFSIDFLSDIEIGALVDQILRYESSGVLTKTCSLSREQRLSLCTERAQRQLLVAMLQMRHGKGFIDILRGEYSRVAELKHVQEAYGIVCYLQQYSLISKDLLLRALKLTKATEVAEFNKSSIGLVVENGRGVSARHPRIAREVSRFAFDADGKMTAILSVLSAVKVEEAGEERILRQFIASEGIYRRIAGDLIRDSKRIEKYCTSLQGICKSHGPYYEKFSWTMAGMIWRLLGKIDDARGSFEQSHKIDPQYEFALRQWAWLEHSTGNLARAATLAMDAAKRGQDAWRSQHQCARILTMNTLAYFRHAEQYYRRAIELNPTEKIIERDWQNYQKVVGILPTLSGIKETSLLPNETFDNLRPSLAFIRAIHGPDSKEVRRKLMGVLFAMQEDVNGNVDEVNDRVGDTQIGPDRRLRALLLCNLARAQYLEWYHDSVQQDMDKIENMFMESVVLDSANPYSHCWYGTFLKEVRKDSPRAEKEYRQAITLGNKAISERQHDHPMFLNNMALLFMDDVFNGSRPTKKLSDAHRLLKKAVKRTDELESQFAWARHTLGLCEQMMSTRSVTAD